MSLAVVFDQGVANLDKLIIQCTCILHYLCFKVPVFSLITGTIRRFLGNHTHVDYFKLLSKDGNSLLIGARNIVYNLSLPSLEENVDQVYQAFSTT